MVSSSAGSVDEYVESLAGERRHIVTALRGVVLEHLQPGFEEAMAFGMPCVQVPLAVSGPTYNGQPLVYIGIANQKQAVSLYLMPVYMRGDVRERFTTEWLAHAGRLDMGKSCVRIKHLSEVPLDVVAWAAALHSPAEFAAESAAIRAR